VVHWIHTGRLCRRDDDRWRVDPASVNEELKRLSRASWWRRVDVSIGYSQNEQQAATKRLLRAASAWRRNPTDPDLTLHDQRVVLVDDVCDLREPAFVAAFPANDDARRAGWESRRIR
jgi:hypothetical protein